VCVPTIVRLELKNTKNNSNSGCVMACGGYIYTEILNAWFGAMTHPWMMVGWAPVTSVWLDEAYVR
jgi:hypothetical protein